MSTPTKCWKSGMAWYGHIHGRSKFSEQVWSSGSAGLQHGQHPNHSRGPTASTLGAQYNHQVRFGGPFNHSAENSGGRVCPWAQLRTSKSSRYECQHTVYKQSPAVVRAHISHSRIVYPQHQKTWLHLHSTSHTNTMKHNLLYTVKTIKTIPQAPLPHTYVDTQRAINQVQLCYKYRTQ